MVKASTRPGIEVILDVVYNHTAEAGRDGPTLSLPRARRPRLLPARPPRTEDAADEPDDTTGTSPAAATPSTPTNPQVLRLILDSLRYWVTEMHVDGFRFDLLSALTRTGHEVDMNGALLTTIGQDPVLRHVKLIAEPWDASMDGYRVGEFPPPWVEWNDQYRDTDARLLARASDGDPHASPPGWPAPRDLYADDGRSPYASINFVTAHDGFTLRDLVSYDAQAQRGQRRATTATAPTTTGPGTAASRARPTTRTILALRRRQAANLMATLCLSNGVPMITAGDERGRTQRGNNNAYCQDNEISWVDWRPDDAWLDIYEITRTALRIRREHPALRQRHWFEGRPAIDRRPQGPGLDPPRRPRDDRRRLARRRACT